MSWAKACYLRISKYVLKRHIYKADMSGNVARWSLEKHSMVMFFANVVCVVLSIGIYVEKGGVLWFLLTVPLGKKRDFILKADLSVRISKTRIKS